MKKSFLPLMALFACTDAPAPQPDALSVYQSQFVGNYALGPQCLGQEFVLSLLPGRVNIGETGCTIADVMLDDPSGLTIALNACQSEGEPSPDRTIRVGDMGTGGLRFNGPDSGPTTLQRCTDI